MAKKIEGLKIMDLIHYRPQDGKHGYYYQTGDVGSEPLATQCFFKDVTPMHNNMMIATLLDGTNGYVNSQGELIYPLKDNQTPYHFSEDRAVVVNRYSPKGSYRSFEVIAPSGKTVIAIPGDRYYPFTRTYSNGLLIINEKVEVDNPFGEENIMGFDLKDYIFINLNGNVIFKLDSTKFSIIQKFAYFSDGLMLVSQGKQFAFINNIGEVIIQLPDNVTGCTPFVNGVAEISQKDRSVSYINSLGQNIATPSEDILEKIALVKYPKQKIRSHVYMSYDLEKKGITVTNPTGSFRMGSTHYPREKAISIGQDDKVLNLDLIFEEITGYREGWFVVNSKYGFKCLINIDGEILGDDNHRYSATTPGLKKIYGLDYGIDHVIWFENEQDRDLVGEKIDHQLDSPDFSKDAVVINRGTPRKLVPKAK